MFTRFLRGFNRDLWAVTILIHTRSWVSLLHPVFLIDFLSDHRPLFSFWRPLGRFLIFGRGLEMTVERE